MGWHCRAGSAAGPFQAFEAVDPDITDLVAALRSGDREALDRLFSRLYEQLHERAHSQLRRAASGETLNTTVLVHETWLRFAGPDGVRIAPSDRGHFFALAARAMRQIIIDHARRTHAKKRGAGGVLTGITIDALPGPTTAPTLLALDDALDELAKLDQRLAQLVELRFFAGFTIEETAEALGISARTVKRDWSKARAFLFQRMSEKD
ncbi:MAG: sigma-70 family RNA polymerase sigma factor [Longimicrobiales bacterium]